MDKHLLLRVTARHIFSTGGILGSITTTQLIDRQEFFALGISQSCVPEELVAEEPSSSSTIEFWIAAASGEVLRKFASFMTLPLVSYGEDVKRWVALLAADAGKTVCRLPANSEGYQELVAAVAEVRMQLQLMRRREDAPQGVIDSTPPSTVKPSINRMFGYARTTALPEF